VSSGCKRRVFGWTAALALALVGCGGFFNPAFVNTFVGGEFPLTPGPGADFVLVRVLNETGQLAEFIVTIERLEIVRDDDGSAQFDDQGNVVTRPQRETTRLLAQATAPANDIGVLFPCDETPVNLVGLGENLLPSDTAVFLGGGGAGGATGFGIPGTTLNPLSRTAGNFACGDTVIFRAIRSVGQTGGVKLESFVLRGFNQPSIFNGPNTFVSYQQFLESQVREDE